MRLRLISAQVLMAACCTLALSVAVLADDSVDELVEHLESDDADARNAAADALADLGSRAGDAVDGLVRALESDAPQLRWRAARALAQIGSEAAPATDALVTALEDDAWRVRAHAARALGLIGNRDQAVADALVSSITDEQPAVQRAAVSAVVSLRLDADVLLPLFFRVLDEADPSVIAPTLHALTEHIEPGTPMLREALRRPEGRYWACLIAAELGPAADHCVPELIEAAADEDPETRLQAWMAVASIGPAAADAVPAAIAALDDPMRAVHYAAAYALGNIGAAEAIEALEAHVESDDAILGAISEWALAKLQSKNREVQLRALRRLTMLARSGDNPTLRAFAVRGLAEIKVDPTMVAPALVDRLADEDPTVVATTVDTLVAMKASGVQYLSAALGSERLRAPAAAVLARLGEDAQSAIGALTRALPEADPTTQGEILFALAAQGAAAAEATDVIIERLDDESPEVVYAACFALGKIGEAASAAVARLEQNLDSDDDFLQLASTWALLKISGGDEELVARAVPMLAEALGELDEPGRIEAAVALGELGAAAAEAEEALRAAAENDSSAAVRAAAGDALERITSG